MGERNDWCLLFPNLSYIGMVVDVPFVIAAAEVDLRSVVQVNN